MEQGIGLRLLLPPGSPGSPRASAGPAATARRPGLLAPAAGAVQERGAGKEGGLRPSRSVPNLSASSRAQGTPLPSYPPQLPRLCRDRNPQTQPFPKFLFPSITPVCKWREPVPHSEISLEATRDRQTPGFSPYVLFPPSAPFLPIVSKLALHSLLPGSPPGLIPWQLRHTRLAPSIIQHCCHNSIHGVPVPNYKSLCPCFSHGVEGSWGVGGFALSVSTRKGTSPPKPRTVLSPPSESPWTPTLFAVHKGDRERGGRAGSDGQRMI